MIATTQEQAKKIADELVKRGELSQEESKEFVKEMYEKGKETKLELEQLINTKTKEVLGELNLATKEDIQRLEQRIANIENQKNKLE